MSELTTTDRFELLSADHKDRGDVTDNVSIDRWTNYGKDRLYLNGLRTGDGWVSLKTDESGGDRWTKVEARRELEGDELTIEVHKGHTVFYTIVVRVHGEAFEPVEDEADDEREPELVADGGKDVTGHVDDETIEAAIESNDDPSHPDAFTVAEIRELLEAIQTGAEVGWDTYMDHVEDADAEVVAEDRDTIVLDTGEHNSVAEELDYGYEGEVEVNSISKAIVTQIHHELARERCDRNWGVTHPYVIAKPESFDAGQRYTEAVVNGLQQRGLSPGQAWAYYGVEIGGNSRNNWGLRKGDHDHKNVSDALEKAKQKLPAA